MLSLILAVSLATVLLYLLRSLLAERLGGNGKVIATSQDSSGKGSAAERALKEVYEWCDDGKDRPNQVLVLYGTEYGFSKEVARKTAERIAEEIPTVAPRILNMLYHEFVDFSKEQFCLVCCSTTGDGVVPGDAKLMYEQLIAKPEGSLPNLDFSVIALGDRGYPHFCRAGNLFNTVLQKVTGKNAVLDVKEIDQEEWEEIDPWIEAMVEKLSSVAFKEDTELLSSDYLRKSISSGMANEEKSVFNMSQPLSAPVKEKTPLTTVEDTEDRETVHVEFDLQDGPLEYKCGDALGVIPSNCPGEVDRLVQALKSSPKTFVKAPQTSFEPRPLREVLLHHVDLKSVKPDLMLLILERIRADEEKEQARKCLGDKAFSLDAHGLKGLPEFQNYVQNRFLSDVLQSFPSAELSVEEVLQHSRALIPRFYSISSSQSVDETTVSIAVAVVRYELLSIERKGVATTYLADRVDVHDEAKIYVQTNDNFRLPPGDEKAIVMIGAGTGIAPFRAFLQEREERRAYGQNVLFFGCRHEGKDFLYKEEIQRWSEEGFLELHTAFSRDGPEKVYVQHRLLECAKGIWSLMNSGAHFYVCGDASSMALAVNDALLRIIEEQGSMSIDEAKNFLGTLESQHRYQRDVWIS